MGVHAAPSTSKPACKIQDCGPAARGSWLEEDTKPGGNSSKTIFNTEKQNMFFISPELIHQKFASYTCTPSLHTSISHHRHENRNTQPYPLTLIRHVRQHPINEGVQEPPSPVPACPRSPQLPGCPRAPRRRWIVPPPPEEALRKQRSSSRPLRTP